VLEPQTLTWGEHRKQIRDMDFQQREAAAKAAAAQVRVTSADQTMGVDHSVAPYQSALVLIRQLMLTEKLKQQNSDSSSKPCCHDVSTKL
jgi:hypothetical protein